MDLYCDIIEYAKEEKYEYQQMIASKILEILTHIYITSNDNRENQKAKKIVDKSKEMLTKEEYSSKEISYKMEF